MAKRKNTIWQMWADVQKHWSEPEPGTDKTKGQAALELMQKRHPAEYVRAVRMLQRRVEEQEKQEPRADKPYAKWLAWMNGLALPSPRELQESWAKSPSPHAPPISPEKTERSWLTPSMTPRVAAEAPKQYENLRHVWAQISPPSEAHNGYVAEGHYVIEGDELIMCDEDGKPLPGVKPHKLSPGEIPAQIARRLTRGKFKATPKPLVYPDVGIA